jgi:histidinol-phosphatase
LGKRWWAARGHGAWSSSRGEAEQKLRVSAVAQLADAALSYNNIQGWDGAGHLDSLVALTRTVWRARSIGDMWAYMLLAEGALDIVGEFDLKPYDMAALIPIIEEAGGRFSSLTGDVGPWHGSALATNALLHDTVLETVTPKR